jgi:hypothetical protein
MAAMSWVGRGRDGTMTDARTLTERLKTEAMTAGFAAARVTTPDAVPQVAERLRASMRRTATTTTWSRSG